MLVKTRHTNMQPIPFAPRRQPDSHGSNTAELGMHLATPPSPFARPLPADQSTDSERCCSMNASGFGKLVGASHELHMIKEEIEIVSRSDARILITGESGVGKDVVARLIHERSGRPGPFVTINCAGVPDS